MAYRLDEKQKVRAMNTGCDSGVEEEKTSEKSFCKHRRTLLKVMLAQIALGPLAVRGVFAAPKNFNADHYAGKRNILPGQIPRAKVWLVSDPTLCVGCRTCEMVCAMVHQAGCTPRLGRLHIRNDPFEKLVSIHVMPEVCRQCNEPDCYLACAYGAQAVDKKTGARIILPEKCVGCGECFDACPWDMIVLDDEANKALKCDLCGGDPQCVKYCPAGALKYVSLL